MHSCTGVQILKLAFGSAAHGAFSNPKVRSNTWFVVSAVVLYPTSPWVEALLLRLPWKSWRMRRSKLPRGWSLTDSREKLNIYKGCMNRITRTYASNEFVSINNNKLIKYHLLNPSIGLIYLSLRGNKSSVLLVGSTWTCTSVQEKKKVQKISRTFFLNAYDTYISYKDTQICASLW